MDIRKILPVLGFITLAFPSHSGFAKEEQQICPSVRGILYSPPSSDADIPNVHSYKATGDVYFLKKCANSKALCKTGSYIITGDYFIAIPTMDGYYCAAYIPNGYQHPKATGLIKDENFVQTKLVEYDILRYKYGTPEKSWYRPDGSNIIFLEPDGNQNPETPRMEIYRYFPNNDNFYF